jgi:SCY1-like protein 2
MPATAMFSKFKHGATGQNALDNNPIVQYFEIGKQTASAGPELVWRIHDAYRKSDGKVRVAAVHNESTRQCTVI